MCTVTLSYDKNNATARQQLESLLSTGLFYVRKTPWQRDIIDYSDPWLYEDHGDLPQLQEGKESYTPEEVLDIIVKDVREIAHTKKLLRAAKALTPEEVSSMEQKDSFTVEESQKLLLRMVEEEYAKL